MPMRRLVTPNGVGQRGRMIRSSDLSTRIGCRPMRTR